MTNATYPHWKVIEETIFIDETKEDYLWIYEELKKINIKILMMNIL